MTWIFIIWCQAVWRRGRGGNDYCYVEIMDAQLIWGGVHSGPNHLTIHYLRMMEAQMIWPSIIWPPTGQGPNGGPNDLAIHYSQMMEAQMIWPSII